MKNNLKIALIIIFSYLTILTFFVVGCKKNIDPSPRFDSENASFLSTLEKTAYTLDESTFLKFKKDLEGENAIQTYEFLIKQGKAKKIIFNVESGFNSSNNAEVFENISKSLKTRGKCAATLVCWYWGTCYAGNGSCPPNCSPISPKMYYRPKYYKWWDCVNSYITTTFYTNCGSCPS